MKKQVDPKVLKQYLKLKKSIGNKNQLLSSINEYKQSKSKYNEVNPSNSKPVFNDMIQTIKTTVSDQSTSLQIPCNVSSGNLVYLNMDVQSSLQESNCNLLQSNNNEQNTSLLDDSNLNHSLNSHTSLDDSPKLTNSELVKVAELVQNEDSDLSDSNESITQVEKAQDEIQDNAKLKPVDIVSPTILNKDHSFEQVCLYYIILNLID